MKYRTYNSIVPAKLCCEIWPGAKPVAFESSNVAGGYVRVWVGDNSELISRKELAAAASLFAASDKDIIGRIKE